MNRFWAGNALPFRGKLSQVVIFLTQNIGVTNLARVVSVVQKNEPSNILVVWWNNGSRSFPSGVSFQEDCATETPGTIFYGVIIIGSGSFLRSFKWRILKSPVCFSCGPKQVLTSILLPGLQLTTKVVVLSYSFTVQLKVAGETRLEFCPLVLICFYPTGKLFLVSCPEYFTFRASSTFDAGNARLSSFYLYFVALIENFVFNMVTYVGQQSVNSTRLLSHLSYCSKILHEYFWAAETKSRMTEVSVEIDVFAASKVNRYSHSDILSHVT